MKYFLLTPVLFIVFTLSAQTRKFQLGLQTQVGYSQNKLTSTPASSAIRDFYADLEKPSAAWGTHLIATYALTNHWSFSFGLGYNQTGYKYPRRKLDYANPAGTEPTEIEVGFISQDISIPIAARYYFTSKRHLYLTAGLMPLLNIGQIQKHTFWYENGSTETNTSDDISATYRAWNYRVTSGIGYEIRVKNNFSIQLQPVAEFSLLPTTKNTEIKRYPLMYGISMIALF